jgi:two-component system sensor histidine kinase PrrB
VDEVTSRAGAELVVTGADTDESAHLIWPDGVRLAVDNVVRNAFTHGRPRDGSAPEVAVEVCVRHGRPVIVVDDNGPGVAPDDRDRVVAPFERATDEPGSGLGLAVADRVARAHGGAVSVGVAPGGGAGVTIELGPSSPGRNSEPPSR